MNAYINVKMYSITVAPSAFKNIRNLDNSLHKRIEQRIGELALKTRHAQSKKVKGEDNVYSNRVGDYRILYKIHDDELNVLVLHVRHRKEIYRELYD
jgi:mRNA interferase RelE/StbE